MKQITINITDNDYKLLCQCILVLKNINVEGKVYKRVSNEDITGILSSVWKQSNIKNLLETQIGATQENGSKSK